MTIKDETHLIAEYIEPHPAHPGIANARLRAPWLPVPVWALAGDLPMFDGDVAALAAAWELPVDAVAAAIAYYRRHQPVIDARIEANTLAATLGARPFHG